MKWKRTAAVVLLLAGCVVAAWCDRAGGEEPVEAKVEAAVDPVVEAMLVEGNRLRAGVGLRAHATDARLAAAAADHAVYMARVGGMNHYTNGGPGGRATRHGWSGGVLENIAYGYPTVRTCFGEWWRSSGHHANLCSSTARAGYACAASTNGTRYWCAVYGNAAGDVVAVSGGSGGGGSGGGGRGGLLGRIFGGRGR